MPGVPPRLLMALGLGMLPRLFRRTLLTLGPFSAPLGEVQALDFPVLPEVLQCGEMEIRPMLSMVGAGAQGAVYKTQVEGKDQFVALKVSRQSTGTSVSRECAILRKLQHVPNVVRCIEDCMISGRQSIVLSPFFSDAKQVTSSSTLADPATERRRISSLLTTATMLLNANVAVSDVQVLQKTEQSDLLWIDFTEAKLPSEGLETFNVAAQNFVSEVFSMIPISSRPIAIQVLAKLCASQPGSYSSLWAELPWNEDGDVPELQSCS